MRKAIVKPIKTKQLTTQPDRLLSLKIHKTNAIPKIYRTNAMKNDGFIIKKFNADLENDDSFYGNKYMNKNPV